MSSGLSSTCETAIMLSKDYDGKVEVVNNQRISVTQKTSVLDAVRLAKAGKSALEIKENLEAEKLEASIYITVDTLKYLKKGRANHTGCGCDRNSAQSKAGASDPGGKAGCICQSKRLEAGEKDDAGCDRKRSAASFWR